MLGYLGCLGGGLGLAWAFFVAGFLLFGLGGGGFLDWFGWRLMVRGFAVFFLWMDALWTMFGSYFSRLGFFPFWARCLGRASSVHVLFFFFMALCFFFIWLAWSSWRVFFTRTFAWAISWSASLHNHIEHSNKSLDRWMLSCLFFSDGVMKMHMDVMIIFLPEKTLTMFRYFFYIKE